MSHTHIEDVLDVAAISPLSINKGELEKSEWIAICWKKKKKKKYGICKNCSTSNFILRTVKMLCLCASLWVREHEHECEKPNQIQSLPSWGHKEHIHSWMQHLYPTYEIWNFAVYRNKLCQKKCVA